MKVWVRNPDRGLGGWDLDLWLHMASFLSFIATICIFYETHRICDYVSHSFVKVRAMKAYACSYIAASGSQHFFLSTSPSVPHAKTTRKSFLQTPHERKNFLILSDISHGSSIPKDPSLFGSYSGLPYGW